MKKSFWASLVTGVLILGISTIANAVIIEGSFTGTVNDSLSATLDENTGNYITRPDLLIGESITGSFTYDTDLAPPSPLNDFPDEEHKQIGSYDWLSITFMLNDGTVYGIGDQDITGGEAYDRTMIINDYYSSYSNAYQDSFNAEESVDYFNDDGVIKEIYKGLLKIRLAAYSVDFLSDKSLIQTFSVDDTTGFFASWGSYVLESSVYDSDEYKYISRSSETIKFDINSISVSPAPVPEPATMILLGSGLIGLVGFRRKFRKS